MHQSLHAGNHAQSPPIRHGGLLFLALALVFCWDTTLLGPFAFVRVHDSFDGCFVEYIARGRMLFEQGFFDWDPFWAGGMPADVLHFTPYYVLSVLSAFVPTWATNAVLRLFVVWAAGWGTCRLLREHFGVAPLAAMFGGALFLFSSQTLVPQRFFEHVFPLFYVWSLTVFGPAEQPNQSTCKRLLCAAGVLLMLAISYPVITTPYFPALQLVLILVTSSAALRPARLTGFFLLWVGYALSVAPTIVTLLQYVPQMQRTYELQTFSGSLDLLRAFGLLAVGNVTLAPALLLVLYLLPGLIRRRSGAVMLTLFVLSVFVGTLFGGRFSETLARSFLTKMDLAHFSHFLVPLELALLVGIGMDAGLKAQRKGSLLLALGGAAGLAALGLVNPVFGWRLEPELVSLCAGIFLLWGALPTKDRGESLSWFALLRHPRMALGAAAFALALAAVQSQSTLHNTTHFMHAKIYASHPALYKIAEASRKESFRVGCVGITPSLALSHGLESAEFRGALMNRRYKELFALAIEPQLAATGGHNEYFDYWTQLTLSFSPPQGVNLPLFAAENWNADILRLLNIRYLLSAKPIPGIEAYADFVGESRNWLPRGLAGSRFAQRLTQTLWIYELRGAFPRGWLTHQAEVLPDGKAVLTRMASANATDLRSTAFLSAQDLPPTHLIPGLLPLAKGAAVRSIQASGLTLTHAGADRLVFEGMSQTPGLLVVAVNFDPGWSATVNGKKAPILRADHAFQAVTIEQRGPVRVELRFAQPGLPLAYAVAMAGLLLILASLVSYRLFKTETSASTLLLLEEPTLAITPGILSPLLGALLACGVWAVLKILHPGLALNDGYTLYTIGLNLAAGLGAGVWLHFALVLAYGKG